MKAPILLAQVGGLSLCSEEAEIAVTESKELDILGSHGGAPDYGSGPHLALVAAMVRLARRDLANPDYSAEAREFLRSDFVALFADCLGFDGEFDA